MLNEGVVITVINIEIPPGTNFPSPKTVTLWEHSDLGDADSEVLKAKELNPLPTKTKQKIKSKELSRP